MCAPFRTAASPPIQRALKLGRARPIEAWQGTPGKVRRTDSVGPRFAIELILKDVAELPDL